MRHSKYIILDNDLETPIVFSPLLQHVDVAAGKKVLSAGFCRAGQEPYKAGEKFHVWGESVSLKLKSRPEDEKILENYLEYNC